MTDAPLEPIEFLRKLQRLLDEGEFVATYKFALLNALADIAVELDPLPDGSLLVPLDGVAEKFIDYYWQQAAPYRPRGGETAVLLQNAGRQAAIVTLIAGVREGSNATLAQLKRTPGWSDVRYGVRATVEKMPLWKLQTLGREMDEFLYRRREAQDGCIRLLPGVADSFRSLHGIVVNMVRGAWVRKVVQIKRNREFLGDTSDLSAFLFGAGRAGLQGYRPIVRAHQRARCLYCQREVKGEGVVDHFIPWARYPVDLGHNFVFAHAGCNSKKRDYLAHSSHLARWYELNIDHGTALSPFFGERGLPNDLERSRAIARWAYEQGEASGAHLWIQKDEVVPIDRSWRAVFG